MVLKAYMVYEGCAEQHNSLRNKAWRSGSLGPLSAAAMGARLLQILVVDPCMDTSEMHAHHMEYSS